MSDGNEGIVRKPLETEPEGVRVSPAGARNDPYALTLPPCGKQPIPVDVPEIDSRRQVHIPAEIWRDDAAESPEQPLERW